MDSNQANTILEDIYAFLDFYSAKLTLTELESNNYTNDYSDKILPKFMIFKHMPSSIKIDNGSCYLLPEEHKHLVCGRSTPNGNCLFNSASVILYGDESNYMQLRLAVIIELMKNARRYLEIDVFETDIIYSNDALDSAELLKNQKKENFEYQKHFAYLSELKRMCCNFSWCSLMALYGLANVVKQPVYTIYPEVKSTLIREIYNCRIEPFQPLVVQPFNETDIIFEQPLFILWTNTSIHTKMQAETVLNKNKFVPNHFVPCFLESKKIKSIEYIIDISDNNDTDINDDSDSTIKDDSDYNPNSDWLKEILMEEPFNLGPDPTCSAVVFALENWARNKNVQNKFNEEDVNLLINASNELNTWPDFKGLEWIINDWKKYFNKDKNETDINNDLAPNDKSLVENNDHLIGLLIGIDEEKNIPNRKTSGNFIQYDECKDFSFKIPYNEVFLNLLMKTEENIIWKESKISNAWIIKYLQKQSQFPPQIAVAVKKSYNNNREYLRKHMYCSGCKNENKPKTSFYFDISRKNLFMHNDEITISIKYLNKHNVCYHIPGKFYGQCRGVIREELSNIEGQPRDIRKKALENTKSEIRFTGNRQNIPSANASRTIKSETNASDQYNILENLHTSIIKVNYAEQNDYIKKNGVDSLKRRKLMGYIQEPIQTQPLSIVFYNEASLEYYHTYASMNPGIFIDYTGQLIKPVPPYLCAKYQDNKNDYPKILNAFITMASGKGSNAPPIDVLELATNDLTASNLQRFINKFRDDELKIYHNRTVPYLINCDCGRNILVACLAAYNNETIRQYNERILKSLINNEKIDPGKIIIAWCYSHCINAIKNYTRSKKLKTEEYNVEKTIFSKFAMKMWNKIRINTTLVGAINEIGNWNWFLNQKSFQLKETNVHLEKDASFITDIFCFNEEHFSNEFIQNLSDEESDEDEGVGDNKAINSLINQWSYKINNNLLFIIMEENEIYIINFPSLSMNIKVIKHDIVNQLIFNPLYNPSLQKYFKSTWWNTILFWSDIIPIIKNRTRRTTATVEVENNIVKNMDIKKRNLPIDQYVRLRVESIKSTQNLVAERLLQKIVKQNSKKVENDDPKEQWDKRKNKQLTKSEKLFLERFKSAVDKRRIIGVTSQKQIAHEICLNSRTEIGFNQSMVSKMYNGTHIPKCNYTIDAITLWIAKEENK